MADNFTPASIPVLYLSGSGVSASATSVTVKNDSVLSALAMSNFGDIGYGAFEPGTGRWEIATFTGITQNADGTTTFTGVTRGVNHVAPYTGDSSRAYAHGGDTKFIITNPGAFYSEYAARDNDETILGTHTYTSPNFPRMDVDTADPTDDEQLVTKGYMDRTLGAGTASINRQIVAATAGETIAAGDLVYFDTVTNNEWMKCDADTAASVDNVYLGIAQGAGTDGNLISGGVLVSGIDSTQTGMTAGDLMYASNTTGEISSTPGTTEVTIGIAKSATELYMFPRLNQQITENEQDALAGTSGTPSASNKYVTADDVSDAGAASKVVRADASSQVTVAATPTASTHAASKGYVDTASGEKVTIDTTGASFNSTSAEQTLGSVTLPGGTLDTDNGIKIEIPITDWDCQTTGTNSCTFRLKYGSTTIATAQLGENESTGPNGLTGKIEAYILSSGTTSSQEGSLLVNIFGIQNTQPSNTTDSIGHVAAGTATEDSTGDLTLSITAQYSGSPGVNDGMTVPHAIFTKIR